MKAVAKTEKAELVPEQNRAPRWVLPGVKAAILLADAILTVACFMLAFYLREGLPILSKTAWAWSSWFVPYAGILIVAIPIRLAVFSYQNIYRLQGAFSYIAEAIKISKSVAVGSLFLVAWAFLFRGGFAFRDFSYSRGIFLLDFGLALVAFTVFHLGIRYLQTLVRKKDVNLIPTLIVGQNEQAAQTIRALTEHREMGYRIVGLVSTDEKLKPGKSFNDIKVVGSLENLPDVIQMLKIQEVIITENTIPNQMLFDVMMQLGRKRRVEFRLAPSVMNFMPQKTSVEQIGVLPMVTLFCEPLTDAERLVKRISDILIALVAIILTAPIWIVSAILIKLDSTGGVLFRQERVGMDGRLFLCYKFRTMRQGADDTVHREAYIKNIEGHSEANSGDEESPVFGKVKDDPRVTRIGKFLRRTSLDELPQLLNVLRGDMSVVGPRPPIPYEVVEYDIHHRRRLDMKPGITGLWQVSGRNRLSFQEMVDIDLFYIENWSLWLDLKIVLLTLPAILRGDGAR